MKAPGERESGPRLLVARGARAAERAVMERLEELVEQARADPGLLARPVWVVVPSRSLRQHVTARLVERLGRAVAGVHVATLHKLAAEIVRTSPADALHGERLFPVLVERFARREPALRAELDALREGYAPLVETVRDLLHAGFEVDHAEAVTELLAERGEPPEGRLCALVRVAAGVAAEASKLDLATPASLLRRAADLLAADPERALPARAVLVHGFADATGVGTDLVEALMRRRDAWVVLDEPPDPADRTRPDPGVTFSQRFAERLAAVARREGAAGDRLPAAQPALFAAPGAHAEAREVAQRIRVLLDEGVRAETIAVAARDLAPYAAPLHLHLSRLAVPFSGVDAAGSSDADARRLLALELLLEAGDEALTDVWLNAAADLDPLDLRLGLRVLGAVRLADVAALDADALLGGEDALPLPVRRGLAEVNDANAADGASRIVAPRRRLVGRSLRLAVARAGRLVARLLGWPNSAGVGVHRGHLKELLTRDLGWSDTLPAAEALQREVDKVIGDVPDTFALGREEFLTLLHPVITRAALTRLGGDGGGVQVLGVTEARGRTFSHLFVLGANRDSFPRTVREDPLLPDGVRAALAALLPDLPIKRAGFDEERYLFAHLLAAAERATVSWQSCDDDGKVRPPSPLVERLALGAGLGVSPLISDAKDALRTPLEHAVLAGLRGSRSHFGDVVAVACRDAGEGAPPGLGDPVALAATRVAVLDELDPDRRTRAGRLRWAGLGPYFGFVGAPLERADPRRDPPFLTRIECIATCPWQAFLRHLLHVAQPPDSALLPGLGANLVGALLHAVLARIVREAIGSPPPALADALACEPTPVPWPAAGELERLLDEEARALLRREGIALAGLARLLATRARPALLRARDLEWGGGTATVAALAAEASGEVSIPGKTRPIRFIADRVDRGEDGAILTDYKTGVPFSDAKQRTTQRRHLLAAVRSGRRLQAAAYALASGSACGRYLFLRPGRQAGLPSELRFEADDPDLPAVFAAAVGAALTTWDAGSLFPRLVTPDGRQTPPACTGCEVRDACLQGDSGARARLLDWAVEAQRAADEGRPSASPAEAAMLAAWRLAFKEKDATSSAGEGS